MHALTHLASVFPSLAQVSSSVKWETTLFALLEDPLSSETLRLALQTIKYWEDPAEILLIQSAHRNVREQAIVPLFK